MTYIHQFFFDKTSFTEGSNVLTNLGNGSFLEGALGKNFKIKQLGIQTIPGITFRINDSLQDSTIGPSGIFHLALEGTYITSIKFNTGTLDAFRNEDSFYLIIDVIYEKEGVGV